MYTVDYFIKKFEAIPETEWSGDATACAYTHCGQYREGYKTECPALSDLFKTIHSCSKVQMERDLRGESYHGFSWLVTAINDNLNSNDTPYKQSTPKARILAALHDIKAMQDKEQKPERIKTVYVSVPETIKEQSQELIMS